MAEGGQFKCKICVVIWPAICGPIWCTHVACIKSKIILKMAQQIWKTFVDFQSHDMDMCIVLYLFYNSLWLFVRYWENYFFPHRVNTTDNFFLLLRLKLESRKKEMLQFFFFLILILYSTLRIEARIWSDRQCRDCC